MTENRCARCGVLLEPVSSQPCAIDPPYWNCYGGEAGHIVAVDSPSAVKT
jgi:hypothetical protein